MSDHNNDIKDAWIRVRQFQDEVDRLGSFAHLGGEHKRKWMWMLHQLAKERTVLELLEQQARLAQLRQARS